MKKVLSFVLVLSLVLSSFSMAFAGEVKTGLTDIEGVANEEAITVVNDLGIVTGYTDGTFKADKAVNRAEFAVMITKALAVPESALAGYTATNFTDVAGYEWAVPYLAFCESKGIMSGYGDGIVKPGNTISVNEAMAMALRAVGYTPNSSILVGTWPSNYVTLAQDKGLYDDVKAVATVDRGSAAQIIYNSLTVAKVQVAADGKTEPVGGSMLTLGLNCDLWEDFFVEYGDASIISLVDYVGGIADVYVNEDEEIVAVSPVTGFLTGTFNEDGKFEVGENEFTLGANVRTTAPAIENLVVSGAATIGTVQADTTGTYTLAVDASGKTIKDIFSVAKWTVTKADYAAEDVQEILADDQELLGYSFALNSDQEIDETTFALHGVASLDKIAEDDVVYVYTLGNGATADIVKVEVGTKTVEGTVTKVNSANDEFTIAGNKYAASNEIISAVPAVGDTGVATLDFAGDIYEWDATKAASENYAVVVEDVATVGRTETTVLLDKAGNEKEYVLDLDTTEEAIYKNPANVTIGSIITFELNKDGEVDEFSTPANIAINGEDVSEDFSVIGTRAVAAGVVVFLEEDGDYSLGKVADLAEAITGSAVLNEDGEIAALLVNVDFTGTVDSTFGVVNAYGDTEYVEADDETYVLADIVLDGKVKEAVRTDVVVAATTSVGALQKITVDADGVIAKVEAATNDTDVTALTSIGSTVSAVSGKVITLANGNAYKIADNAIVYVWNDTDEVWETKSLTSVKKAYVALYDLDDNTANGYEVVMANADVAL